MKEFLIFFFIVTIILYSEYYIIVLIIICEFILRLFGRSFDDKPKKIKKDGE